MLQPAHPLVSTICIVWTEDLEHLRRRQYNVTTCRLVTSTLVNICANFQSCARQQSSSQESRFTDVYLKPATQTDHAKKKNGATKRKIFSLFLIKHTVVVNEQKIGTLKTGCLIEGDRLIQGCYILDQLYLTSNAFWNLEMLSKWLAEWVSEWVSEWAKESKLQCLEQLKDVYPRVTCQSRTYTQIHTPTVVRGGGGVDVISWTIATEHKCTCTWRMFRNVQKETTHLLEVLNLLFFVKIQRFHLLLCLCSVQNYLSS